MENTIHAPETASISAVDTLVGQSRRSAVDAATVEIGLSAAIITVRDDQPEVLVVRGAQNQSLPNDNRAPVPSLPFGPFTPRDHRTLDTGLRSWVSEQTGLSLNYVEQLYTFADRGRHSTSDDRASHVVSIGYLALLRPHESGDESDGASWRSWYDFFPWEDWRAGKPAILTETIEPLLNEWCQQEPGATTDRAISRKDRLHMTFGLNGGTWDEEKVLERFELMYEAGLVEEAVRDGRPAAGDWSSRPTLGQQLSFDHRRILATAIGRIRAKIKYRPVVFELMPDEFTLFELQKTVEAILGPHLHKQNFRRLVESAGLVETTGEVRAKTGGRPARLYQFRRQVLLERPAPGVRVNLGRG